jgi:hypothetical protein
MGSYELEVHVDGLDEFERKLEELPIAVMRDIVDDAMLEGTFIIYKEIQAGAPKLQDKAKAPNTPRGFLRAHLWRADFKVAKNAVRALVRLLPEDVFYPEHIVKFKKGKNKGKTKPGSRRDAKVGWRERLMGVIAILEYGSRHSKANPFWSRGFENSRFKAADKIVKMLEEGIAKVWGQP